MENLGWGIETGIGYGLAIAIGDWNLELEIKIGNWDKGLGLRTRIGIEDLDQRLGIQSEIVRIVDWRFGMKIGDWYLD